MASEEPCNVLARFLKDRLDLGKPIQLRVSKYFPRVPTFEYNEDGTVDKGSLMGPARIEAKEQLVREKMVAVEETRLLKEALGLCFRREGVNSAEHCKPLVEAYAAKLSTPHYGMLNVSECACCTTRGSILPVPLQAGTAWRGPVREATRGVVGVLPPEARLMAAPRFAASLLPAGARYPALSLRSLALARPLLFAISLHSPSPPRDFSVPQPPACR